MEHRWGSRILVDIPIEMIVATMSRMDMARIANISMTGAFIEVDFRPRPPSRVQIMFPSSQADVVNIAAYVIRHTRHVESAWNGAD